MLFFFAFVWLNVYIFNPLEKIDNSKQKKSQRKRLRLTETENKRLLERLTLCASVHQLCG